MRTVILSLVMLVLTGCSTMDVPYNTAKDIYTVGKTVAPLIPMDTETKMILIGADNAATKYDTVRGIVRENEELKKLDANTTLLEYQ